MRGHRLFLPSATTPMEWFALVILAVFLGLIGIFALVSFIKAWQLVKEREVVVIERLGEFQCVLTAGVHWIWPWIDRPKSYSFRYTILNGAGEIQQIDKRNMTRISTQNEVIEFPRQNVITRDNASVYLDAVLSYKIVNPKTMLYSVQNLPLVLSKLLQAQLRNVAGALDIDQIIEEAASLNVLTGLMDTEASRWGVKIVFVKVQKVEAPGLTEVLARKKNADLQNKEVIIGAKASKQTKVIESEGQRDSMIKKAEGQAQEILSKARGEAQAIINSATAEARSIQEIARGLPKEDGEDPAKYLLAAKYLEALKKIAAQKGTTVHFMPNQTAFLQTVRSLGVNAVLPTSMLKYI